MRWAALFPSRRRRPRVKAGELIYPTPASWQIVRSTNWNTSHLKNDTFLVTPLCFRSVGNNSPPEGDLSSSHRRGKCEFLHQTENTDVACSPGPPPPVRCPCESLPASLSTGTCHHTCPLCSWTGLHSLRPSLSSRCPLMPSPCWPSKAIPKRPVGEAVVLPAFQAPKHNAQTSFLHVTLSP